MAQHFVDSENLHSIADWPSRIFVRLAQRVAVREGQGLEDATSQHVPASLAYGLGGLKYLGSAFHSAGSCHNYRKIAPNANAASHDLSLKFFSTDQWNIIYCVTLRNIFHNLTP
jgi:hypothetical protein